MQAAERTHDYLPSGSIGNDAYPSSRGGCHPRNDHSRSAHPDSRQGSPARSGSRDDHPTGTQDRTNRLTTSLRAPLDKDSPRRYAPVDERDPVRVRLVWVCSLRLTSPREWERECEALWRDNLPLAKKFAHDYQRSKGADHIPKEDFEQAAAMGMLTAVRRFDPAKAGKLSTYAVWWMRKECKDVLEDEDLVRVPTAVREDRAKVLALQTTAREEGKEVSPEEAADELGIPLDRVRQALRALPSRRHAEVDPRRDRDEGVPAPDDDAARQLREVLDMLPPAERAALVEEYGVGDAGGGDGEEAVGDPVAQRALRELGLRRARRMVREG